MAQDIMSQFYTCLNLPLHEKILGLTRIIDQTPPNKELQALFPQLISNIFASSFNNGWGIRSLIYEKNRGESSELINFLEPQGPMFRLCYKLLSDSQLKYNLPLNILPIDLQITLERGRCPQFYADMLSTDSQSMNVVALALNPFDYYIFHFALDLLNSNQNKKSWESGSSIYAALVCDYLQQFLPLDPNDSVLPLIPHYSGKVPIAAPLQTSNWPLCTPSLLLIPDLSGMSNQHSSPQVQSRNEVWRTETVVQVFIDIWMSVEQFNLRNGNHMPVMSTSPERVRILRIMVKHIHAFSIKYQNDPAVRSSTLRKYARQIMCARGYQYVKHLVMIWPLDASFRIVIEMWLSLIQPWRYTSYTINQDRFPSDNQYQEETNSTPLDSSFIQFIAENFPSYTCILQQILPRFMRLDLAAYKNTVMLFRLGKVFSQPHLVPILWNLEQAITDNNAGLHRNLDNSYNNLEQSYTYNGIALNKWMAIAKQAISELNLSATFEYTPVWGENRKAFAIDFVKKIISAKINAEKNVEEYETKLIQQHHGVWQSICNFFLLEENNEEKTSIEDFKKAPRFLNNCVHYFSHIFGLNENVVQPLQTEVMDVNLENSSFDNSTSFAHSIASKLRSNPTGIHYMGDPDLMPIASYENTILVRMLHQIASRLNELYGETFERLWSRQDLVGHVAREVLQNPMTVQRYVKDIGNHQTIVNEDLPPRLSLRRMGSHVFVVWFTIGYIIFRFLSYSGIFYVFCIVFLWSLIVLSKASLKRLRLTI